MSKTITLQVDDEEMKEYLFFKKDMDKGLEDIKKRQYKIIERIDYTEWQREYFSNQTLDEFLHKAREYDKRNPFLVENGE